MCGVRTVSGRAAGKASTPATATMGLVRTTRSVPGSAIRTTGTERFAGCAEVAYEGPQVQADYEW